MANFQLSSILNVIYLYVLVCMIILSLGMDFNSFCSRIPSEIKRKRHSNRRTSTIRSLFSVSTVFFLSNLGIC